MDPEAGSSPAASLPVKLEQGQIPKGKGKSKALTDPALASRKGPRKAGGTGDKGPAGKPPNVPKPIKEWHSSLNADISKMKKMKQDCEDGTSTIPEMIRQQYQHILKEGLPEIIALRTACQEAIDGDRVVDDALRQLLETAKTDWLTPLHDHITSFGFLQKAKSAAAKAAATSKATPKQSEDEGVDAQ